MKKTDYLTPFRLLKEARESWDNYISDELVYGVEYGDFPTCRGQGGQLDAYLSGNVWFELHTTFVPNFDPKASFNIIWIIVFEGQGCQGGGP